MPADTHIVEFNEIILGAIMEQSHNAESILGLEQLDNGFCKVFLVESCHRGPFIIAAHSKEEMEQKIAEHNTCGKRWAKVRERMFQFGYDAGPYEQFEVVYSGRQRGSV